MPATDKGAKMLRVDLEAAGIAAEDTSGRVVDFHSLTRTFITNLCNGGVHPKAAQALARHSTITLTMDRYTHLSVASYTDALDALPDLDVPAREEMRATGTDAESVLADCLAFSEGKDGNDRDGSGRKEGRMSRGAGERKGPKTLDAPNVSEPVVSGTRRGTRTPDPRIKNPLLYQLS